MNILFAGICISIFAYSESIDQELQPIINIEKHPWQVEAINLPERGYDIRITDTRSNESFTVEHYMTSVGILNSLYIIEKFLVAIGELRVTHDFALLVNLETKENFYHPGFRPVVSEKGAFIVFERYLARYKPPDEIYKPAIEMVDLRKGPDEIITVFPVEPFQEYDNEGKVHNNVSPLGLSPDGMRLAFLDKHSAYGSWEDYVQYFIVIDFNKSESDRLSITRIDPAAYIFSWKSPDNVRMVFRELKWIDDETLCFDAGSDDKHWLTRRMKINTQGEYLGPCDELKQ